MPLNSHLRRKPFQRSDSGYVLLTLLLIIALGIIFAATLVTSIAFDIRRDREEEMIHRGVQYSRAIRAYYKKFGRYPTKIEDLESANNMRFLRKRYKDPLTGKDFKLLHFGDVKLTFTGGGLAGGINGAAALNNAPPFGSQGPVNGLNPGGQNPGGGFSSPNAGFATPNSFGGNPNGGNSPGGNANNPPGGDSTPPTDQTQNQNQNQNQNSDSTAVSPSPGQQQADAGGASSQVTYGGGPVVGVVSASKKDTIREFNHKHKYNEWQFIYDPASDRGGLLMTPNQPPLQGFGQQGAPNVGAPPNGPFGSNPGGQPNGLGNPNQPPSQPVAPGPGTPSDPGNAPPQPQ